MLTLVAGFHAGVREWPCARSAFLSPLIPSDLVSVDSPAVAYGCVRRPLCTATGSPTYSRATGSCPCLRNRSLRASPSRDWTVRPCMAPTPRMTEQAGSGDPVYTLIGLCASATEVAESARDILTVLLRGTRTLAATISRGSPASPRRWC